MNIEKLSLQQRLGRLNGNYPAHREYIPAVLESFAAQPMSRYFSGFEGAENALSTLAKTLQIPIDTLRDMTYDGVVNEIAWMPDEDGANEAAALLAAPIEAYYAAYLESRKGASR